MCIVNTWMTTANEGGEGLFQCSCHLIVNIIGEWYLLPLVCLSSESKKNTILNRNHFEFHVNRLPISNVITMAAAHVKCVWFIHTIFSGRFAKKTRGQSWGWQCFCHSDTEIRTKNDISIDIDLTEQSIYAFRLNSMQPDIYFSQISQPFPPHTKHWTHYHALRFKYANGYRFIYNFQLFRLQKVCGYAWNLAHSHEFWYEHKRYKRCN